LLLEEIFLRFNLGSTVAGILFVRIDCRIGDPSKYASSFSLSLSETSNDDLLESVLFEMSFFSAISKSSSSKPKKGLIIFTTFLLIRASSFLLKTSLQSENDFSNDFFNSRKFE
jgi:hypothetical protein